MKVDVTPAADNYLLTFTEGEKTVAKHLRVEGLTKPEIGYAIRKRVLEAERDFAHMDGGMEAVGRLGQPKFFGTGMHKHHVDLIVSVLDQMKV